MSFDCSRLSFDAWNDYLGVVMQQGRVQLDSDWNEWVAEALRRLQVGTVDILGAAAVPQATTPNGFLITASNNGQTNALSIGRGRIYVDGLLAENHGLPVPSALKWADGRTPEPAPPVLGWDPKLGELTGTGDTPYTQQPYYPLPPALPADAGPHVVYLDVWQRALTHLQQPDLVEKAVGVDTSERLQTVWQVKVLADPGAGTTCSTALSGLLASAGIFPSGARLTTDVVAVAQPTDPCQVPTSSGYKGLENQLYRVEIHQTSTHAGGASFKWSRDNATVATLVNQITAPDTLIVQSVGKDDVLRFNPLDWIEITDDVQELAGLPGEIHQIKAVQDATASITLQTPLSNTTSYPVDAQGNTDSTRHTRIRRWDQGGKVLKADGTLYWDLDNPANNTVPGGTVPLPAAGTSLVLESGITVSFSLDPGLKGGVYRGGDYWAFAARASDGTVEKLTLAPPRGILHHYAPLAVVTFPNTVTSCRTPWPPPSTAASGCCCTVSVTPADIAAKGFQAILDQLQQNPSTVICLAAGNYSLTEPLRLGNVHSGFTLEGCRGATTFSVAAGSEAAFQDGVVVVDNATGVTLRDLQFEVPEVAFKAPGGKFAGVMLNSLAQSIQAAVQGLFVSIGVRAVNATSLTVERCQFDFGDFEEDNVGAGAMGIGIFGSGQNDGLRLVGNSFAGVGPFLAGYVLGSSVAFNPPVVRIPRPPINVGVADRLAPEAGAAAVNAQRIMKASFVEAGNSLAAADAQKIITAVRVTPTLELRKTSALLGQITGFVAPALNLAANGGAVLPATLFNAVIEDNIFSGTTVAVLILAEPGAVEITGNQANDSGGFWVVSPQYVNLLSLDPPILFGSLMAVGYPLPTGDGSQLTQVAKASAPVRIYAGKSPFTDSQGDLWTPDVLAGNLRIDGGTLNQPAQPAVIKGALPQPQDQALYQSERFGSFTYTFSAVPSGYYQVTLKLAEIFDAAIDKRWINVFINSSAVLVNFDVFASTGGENIATDQVFSNITPVNGQIVIQLAGVPGFADPNAKVGAIEIASQLYEYPGALNDMGKFLVQLETLAQQAFQVVQTPSLILRVDGNTVDGATDLALFVMDRQQAGQQNSLTVNGNFMRRAVSDDGRQQTFLSATMMLSGLDLCTVTGNQILNLNSESPSLIASNAGTGLAVTGNLFKGFPLLPARNLSPPAPPPMDGWSFFNTAV